MRPGLSVLSATLVALVCSGTWTRIAPGAQREPDDAPGEGGVITLRAFGVPTGAAISVETRVNAQVLRRFREKFPHIKPVSTVGFTFSSELAELVPLMQVAGDIPPDVMYVNFRQSHTYIASKLLHPLDEYLDELLGLDKDPERHKVELDEYLARITSAPRYERAVKDRVPRQCWQVMRRLCPYQTECPYCREWGLEATEKHYHVWSFPIGPLVMAMFYRKDLFTDAGLPHRVPKDWEELLAWGKILSNPQEKRYGMRVANSNLSYTWLNFAYAAGARAVELKPDTGQWEAVFDSDEAVDAVHFFARMKLEKITVGGRTFRGIVNTDDQVTDDYVAMFLSTLDDRFFQQNDPALYGFGPAPPGPSGLLGSTFNSRMLGIFAGLEGEKNARKRRAAWEYIRFYDGEEARGIRTEVFVQAGYAQYVNPRLLRRYGYHEYARLVPKGWEESYNSALTHGVPEPYGKNCQLVFSQMDRPLGRVFQDPIIIEAIDCGDDETAKARIKLFLQEGVREANERMLGILEPQEARKRSMVALVVAVAIMLTFVAVFYRVFRIFTPPEARVLGGWQFGKYKWAYILMFPGIGTIALWAYWPLSRGMQMAFLDYNVRGFSTFTGMDNFATVLYDNQFWYSMWVSLKYAALFMLFGFGTPILLAFLLTEVPKGKILFRTIYYLPAVLTGVVVIFLWKNFYGPFGMINQVVNHGIGVLNYLIPLLPALAWAIGLGTIGLLAAAALLRFCAVRLGNRPSEDASRAWRARMTRAFLAVSACAITFAGIYTIAVLTRSAIGFVYVVHETPLEQIAINWLTSARFALLFCLLPTIWAGMGPGCLIYLAALKTIPEDLYEAADIDGAGMWGKIAHIAIPSIKVLIVINFIGAFVGAVKGASSYILAMTAGGPYTPYGETEVVGLQIFYTAFMYLKFGLATAMAWVLGAFLIGFTVFQLQRLSKVEFRTAGRT